MIPDWMKTMEADAHYWVRRWHHLFLMNSWILSLELGCAGSELLDSWSQDSPWRFWLGLLFLLIAAVVGYLLRQSYQHWRVHQRLLYNLQRLQAAEQHLPYTTSPSIAALEQLMASFEELKRL